MVLDDGTAVTGGTLTNASAFALQGGIGVGAQGGSWVSTTFRGRLQVFAPSAGAQVAVVVN